MVSAARSRADCSRWDAPQLTSANSVARVIRARRTASWSAVSFPVKIPRAAAVAGVTTPTAMTWLRRNGLLASSGARTRNPPTITFMATSSTTEITAMSRCRSSQPRLAAAARPAVTGVCHLHVVLLPPGLPDGA